MFLSTTLFAANDTVLVTAERVKADSNTVSQKTLVLDEEEIKSYGAQNAADLLKQLNTGHIQEYPGLSTSIGIRGFRTEAHGIDLRGHVLVLVDGRRAGTGNLTKIMTKNIERIEIINGPAGIQYGSAAMGGVINIITKQGLKDGNLFIEQGVGSFNHLETSIGGSGKFKWLDFSFSGTESKADDYETPDGKYDNTGYGMNNYNINLGLTFLDKHRIGVIVKKFNGYDIGLTNLYDHTALYVDDKSEKTLDSVDVSYDGEYKYGQIKVKYFQGQDKNTFYDKKRDDYFGSPEKSEYKTDFRGAQFTISAGNKMFKVVTGADYNKYKTKNNNSDSVDAYMADSKYENLAAFIMPKLMLFDKKLILTAGARYDDFDLEMKKTDGQFNNSSENFHNTILSAGAVYNITKSLKVRANYGEGFVIPQADQMNSNYMFWGTPYIGNPDLDPESSRTYEAGIDYKDKGFDISATYFYTKFKNKIEQIIVGTFPSSYYTWDNLGKAKISGLELNARFDIGEYLEKSFSLYPYINLVYLGDYRDEENEEDLLYTSKTQMSYGLYFAHYDFGTSVRLNFAYTSDQEVDYYDPVTWTSERKTLDSFTVATLTAEQRVFMTEKFGGVFVSGTIDNLFNESYEYVMGYPMPERAYKGFVKYQYEF
jgi:vitamin B12 transporter